MHRRKLFIAWANPSLMEKWTRHHDNWPAYLQSRGLKPGDRVAIMMPNLLQYPIALFACIRAGFIVVNTNPLYKPRELVYQLKDSGVKGIIIVENFASHLQEILGQTQIETIILTSIGEMLGPIKGKCCQFCGEEF